MLSSGGLSMLLLFDFIRRHRPGPILQFHSRNLCPVYVDHQLTLRGSAAGAHGAKCWIANHQGRLAVETEIQFKPAG